MQCIVSWLVRSVDEVSSDPSDPEFLQGDTLLGILFDA
jgi:hypothetical protein